VISTGAYREGRREKGKEWQQKMEEIFTVCKPHPI
jgi:hypothetical protein